jgi:hypothetical protein
MALLAPGGFATARICVRRPVHVRHRGATFATLSPPRGHAVDWVEATSSFFEQDTRPIMLFDGKALFFFFFFFNTTILQAFF